MRRAPAALLTLAILAAWPGGAIAQGSFWDIFRPRPPVPPAPIPAQPIPEEVPAAPMAPAAPPPLRPLPAKVVGEGSVLGRLLKLNGQDGQLRLERSGRDEWRARISLAGTRISRPGEACKVEPAEALPAQIKGRPDGLLRIEISAPSCPIAGSLLDGAFWVREPVEACLIEAADCRADPRGVWGPEPGALMAVARDIEQERGQADRAVRENYKVLTQRARPTEVRPIVSEQAAFSAEREMVCRHYRGEGGHGFCNARYTEGRAAQLAFRLGVAPPVETSAPAPAPRPRRTPPQAQAVAPEQ